MENELFEEKEDRIDSFSFLLTRTKEKEPTELFIG